MRKKNFMRRIAALLATVLVVTSLEPLAVTVSAEEIAGEAVYATSNYDNAGTYSFNAADLKVAGAWGAQADVSGGDYVVTFSEQYSQFFYEFPEGITADRIKSVSVETNAESLALKLCAASSAGFKEAVVSYWSTAVTLDSASDEVALSDICVLGLMNLVDGEANKTIGKISFELRAKPATEEPGEGEGEKVEDGVYTLDDLTSAGGYGYSLVKDDNGKSIAIAYADQYQEARFNIPESVLNAGLEKIEVITDDASNLAIKSLDASGTQIEVSYGSSVLNVTDSEGVAAIGLMNKAEGEQTINITGIKFGTSEAVVPVTPEEEEKKVETIVLGPDELSNMVNPWNGSDVQGPTINFTSRYQEYDYTLEDAISTDNVESVVVKVKDQGGNICVKFYDSSNTEWFHNYGVDGNTEYTFVPEEGQEIKKIGFMSMLDPDVEGNYPYSITIESVTINVKAGTVAEKQEEVLEFTGDDIKFIHRSEDAEEVGNTLSFSQKWDEYYLDFGKELNMERCKSFTVKVKDQNGLVSYKFYDKDDKEVQAIYQKSGNTSLNPTCDTASRFAVMAHDDDVEYPFTITIESVKIVIDTSVQEVVEKGVEYDIVNLRDAVAETMGDDFLIGTALSYDEFGDANDLALATKHFNAVTLGNELKPDAILGSGNNNLQQVTLNGVTFDFPTLSYSLPESRLDIILQWNEENPDKQIKVRGHVLVWHSQTPSWFFREGYSANGAYVSPEEMNLRLEYYIKSVCEHFTSDGSKYKNMFYGWDVVNEAVSDSRGTYRNSSENSEWWAVYNSNEFITNAFVYANKYMAPSVELYYNDYNDTMTGKVSGIEQLLRDVKATPGARIDGFGMQAHYDVNSPSVDAFCDAARRYAAIVDSVQVTELDFKGATSSKDEKLAQRYSDIYTAIRRLRADGVNFTAMTIWGVTDKHSWLQSSNSVGGSASGNSKQYPLLFDNNYKAKNSFWAIVNAGELMPEIKTVTLVKSVDDKFSAGNEYSVKMNNTSASFVAEWADNTVAVKVAVPDTTNDANDKVVLYVSDGNNIQKVEALRSAGKETSDGYEVVVKATVDTDTIKSNKVKIDVTVTDADKTYAFNDTRLKQDASDDYYAVTVIKASEIVTKGTVVIDGEANDAAWANATEINLAINSGAKASAKAKLLWDNDNLYVLVDVKDAVLDDSASQAHEKDSLEVFIDENNAKSSSYQEDDKQYRINYKNEHSFNGTKCVEDNIVSAVKLTDDGYVIETAIKWTDIEAKAGLSVGFDAQINDAEAGSRLGTINWADTTGNGWSSPSVFGTIVLADNSAEEPAVKNGVYEENGIKFLYIDDVKAKAGLYLVDGEIYCANYRGQVRTGDVFIQDDNQFGLSRGYNLFDENGCRSHFTGIIEADENLYYYEDGCRIARGLVEFEGNYYYVESNGRVTRGDRYVKTTNGLKAAGYYLFDETGAMSSFTGFAEVSGVAYYYYNGNRSAAGLVEYEENYYYIGTNGRIYVGRVYVKDTNGLMNRGFYNFDAEGKMIVQ